MKQPQQPAPAPEEAEILEFERRAMIAVAERKLLLAMELHQDALRAARKLDRPRLLAALHGRLGETLRALGELDAALVAYESGLRALEGLPELDVPRLLRSISGSVKIFDADQTIQDLPVVPVEPMLPDLAAAEADPRLVVRLLLNIGSGYLEQPQEGVALGRFEEALARPEIHDEPRLEGHALTRVALVRLAKDDVDAALPLLERALALLDGDGARARLEQRHAITALGAAHAARGQIEQAFARWEEARALHAEAGDVAAEARVLASMGQVHLEREDVERAADFYGRALETARKVRDFDVRTYAAWGLARCRIAAGALEEAAKLLEESLGSIDERRGLVRTDPGKVRFLGGVADIYDLLISVHLERARTAPEAWESALSVVERIRSRALRDMMLGRRRREPMPMATPM